MRDRFNSPNLIRRGWRHPRRLYLKGIHAKQVDITAGDHPYHSQQSHSFTTKTPGFSLQTVQSTFLDRFTTLNIPPFRLTRRAPFHPLLPLRHSKSSRNANEPRHNGLSPNSPMDANHNQTISSSLSLLDLTFEHHADKMADNTPDQEIQIEK